VYKIPHETIALWDQINNAPVILAICRWGVVPVLWIGEFLSVWWAWGWHLQSLPPLCLWLRVSVSHPRLVCFVLSIGPAYSMLPPTSTNSYDISISTFEPPNNHPVLKTAFLLSFAPDNYPLLKAFLFTFTLPASLFFDSAIQVDGIAHTLSSQLYPCLNRIYRQQSDLSQESWLLCV